MKQILRTCTHTHMASIARQLSNILAHFGGLFDPVYSVRAPGSFSVRASSGMIIKIRDSKVRMHTR